MNDPKASAGPAVNDVWVLPLDDKRRPAGSPYAILNSGFAERLARFSPDHQWVTYQSHESGRAEIYIRPFTDPGRQWQVSTDGGAQPRWRRDGKELYFISRDARLMAASIEVKGRSVDTGAPVALFQTRIYLGGSDNPLRGQYAVAPDGRFLINTLIDDAATPPITIVRNWRPR